MRFQDIRPLYESSDEDLEQALEKYKTQGLSDTEIAATQEGEELSYRKLSPSDIVAAYKTAEAAGIDPMTTPEYLERIRSHHMRARKDATGGKA